MATKNLFQGKETAKEERADTSALRSGKITQAQYAKGERSEPKKGGKAPPGKGKFPAFLKKK